MIGKHNPRQAHNTDFVAAIAIALDEGITALEECFFDLNDDQMQAFPIPGHACIAWITMHALQNLDKYAHQFQTGQKAFTHEWRWNLWGCKPEERPKPGDVFPPQKEILETLHAVRRQAMSAIEATTPEDLLGRRMAEDWWKHTSADAYMRTICHTATHVREVWLLRGALGLTDGKSWPMQHWA